jgi:hypothetical protein
VLAARNRRFRIAAALAAIAALFSIGSQLCSTIALYRGPSPAGAGLSRAIVTLSAIVAVFAWLAIARSFGGRVDRERLRRGAKILVASVGLNFLGAALFLYVNLANPGFTRYRISVGFDAVSYFLIAAAVAIAWRSLRPDRSPGAGLRQGAFAFAFAYLAALGAAIFTQAYYSSFAVPGALTAGLTLEAAGAAVVVAGAAIAAIAFGHRATRREEGLAVAGAIVAGALLCVVFGEVLVNAHLGVFHYAGLEIAGGWIGVGYRVLSAASFAVAAWGASAAD